jgi:hypothetical protein
MIYEVLKNQKLRQSGRKNNKTAALEERKTRQQWHGSMCERLKRMKRRQLFGSKAVGETRDR